ncbi:MAG TPA: glutamate-cysteine ligase family protein, partial [Rubrobacteraceae bacterium]|nr:glutamate-cysteine ligase family protein [Rubrobacteraceae bacterium]
LEQEFFLVDGAGALSDRADEFLARCQEAAGAEGLKPEGFVEECSRYLVEIHTPPAYTVTDLSRSYLKILNLALRTGRELDIRLYPLATYPLPLTPALRVEPRYELQARTLGRGRFLHAERCAGVHLHLELPARTVDPDSVVSHNAPAVAREELLNLYNLGTALDPALIALARACPFYEGRAPGLAVRAAFYRGSALFGWEGLYTDLPEVGDLRPYARSVEELVERRLADHRAWLEAMDRAGVERRLFFETGGNVLKSSWNPVRLNQLGTVELREIDGNYPEVVLAVATLVHDAASRVTDEGLMVEPAEGARTFKVSGDRLFVPYFVYLSRNLFYAAATGGAESPEVSAYLDSVLEFAAPDGQESGRFTELRSPGGAYHTTEAEILQNFPPTNARLPSSDEGLRLVRESCDRLEEQVLAATRAAGSGP